MTIELDEDDKAGACGGEPESCEGCDDDDVQASAPWPPPSPSLRPPPPTFGVAFLEAALGIGQQCISHPEKFTELLERAREARDREPVLEITQVEGGYILQIEVKEPIGENPSEIVGVFLEHAAALLGEFSPDIKPAQRAMVEALITKAQHQHELKKLLTRRVTKTRVVADAYNLPEAIEAMLKAAKGS